MDGRVDLVVLQVTGGPFNQSCTCWMPCVALFASSGAWSTTDGTMRATTPPKRAKKMSRVMDAAPAGGTPRLVRARVGGHSTVLTTIASITGSAITHSFCRIQPTTNAPIAIAARHNDHFANHNRRR